MDVEAITVSHRRSRVRRWLGGLVAASCLLASAAPLCAQKPTEYDIKAAYLFNFGKFLRVPDEPVVSRRTSFDICVLGRNDFGGTLERLTANEQNDGLPERTINVASAAGAKGCAILFISSSEADRIDGDLAELDGMPVLTVSDVPRFLERGGMIALEMEGNHVRFSVALDAVNRAGLTLSSELLKVASRVTGKPKGDVR